MIQVDAQVMDVGLSGPFVSLTLAAPSVAAELGAGRCVLAGLGDYLRTPLFPARIEPENGTFDISVLPEHPAARLRPGAQVNLLGPVGRGFRIPAEARRLLLIADVPHLPALLPLLRAGEPGDAGRLTALLLLVSSPTSYPLQLLPPFLEVYLADSSGAVCDRLPDLARWADTICLAGELTTYPALAQIVREVRPGAVRRFAQALVAPPMACGVGACQGCAVKTTRGIRLACSDGPVFDLRELESGE